MYSAAGSGSEGAAPKRRKFRVLDFARHKQEGVPIVMLTAYDALFASLVDLGGIDVILVGDSLGTVLAGETTTLPVTMEQMIYHGRLACRGAKHAFVVVDLP